MQRSRKGKEMNKKKTKSNPLLLAVLMVMLCFGLVINLIIPDRGFSQSENRTLKSFPAMSWNQIKNGEKGQEIDSWYSDQIVGRNLWFHLNYAARKMAGQKEISEVFLGKGALLGQSSPDDHEIISGNVQGLLNFMNETSLPLTMMIAPNAGSVQPEKLPANAPFESQQDVISQICVQMQESEAKWMDVYSILDEMSSDYIYYKTDHHWTSEGAGLVMKAWQDLDLESYDFMKVSTGFKGTLASKTGSIFLDDDIEIAVAQDNPDYVVTWADGSKTSSIYNTEALEQKDQYQVFLGANQAVVRVDTTVANGKNLLILKDSYANCCIQYLLPLYQSITIVDPRYYYEDLSSLLDMYSITEAAVIFSCDTFVSDPSISSTLSVFTPEVQEEEEA